MFHQAILTSGTEMGSWAVSNPDNYQDILFVRAAENLGCTRDTNDEMMDCMREIDAQYLFDNSMIPCPVSQQNKQLCIIIMQTAYCPLL